MNARWFRDNLSVLVFAVVFVVILAGSIYFLRQASADQATVLQELEGQHGELRGLQETKPYPSKDNVAVIKADIDQIKNLYASMQTAALRETIQSPEFENPIDFSQLVRSTANRLTEEAEKKHMKVGEAFAWGFSRYIGTFPCRNPAANAADCKRLLHVLGKQLTIVEKLSQMLIESKVESISAIRRTEIEPGSSADSLNVPIDDKNPLYHTYPFEVQFVSDTETLRNLLNTLAQANYLYSVRSLHVLTSVQQVRLPSATPARLPTDADFDPKATLEPIKMGDVRRLNVTLRLDLIEFVVPTKPKAGKG